MVLNGKQIFNLILKSLWKNTKDWDIDCHGNTPRFWRSIYWITNEKLGVRIWAANGMPFFEVQNIGEIVTKSLSDHGFAPHTYSYIREEKVRLSILQTTLLHIVYLRKIRRYPYLLILLRYLILGSITMCFIGPLLCYLENYQNKKEIKINISKKEYRNIILEEILN